MGSLPKKSMWRIGIYAGLYFDEKKFRISSEMRMKIAPYCMSKLWISRDSVKKILISRKIYYADIKNSVCYENINTHITVNEKTFGCIGLGSLIHHCKEK